MPLGVGSVRSVRTAVVLVILFVIVVIVAATTIVIATVIVVIIAAVIFARATSLSRGIDQTDAVAAPRCRSDDLPEITKDLASSRVENDFPPVLLTQRNDARPTEKRPLDRNRAESLVPKLRHD